ncbi:related to G-patch domain protein [Cephalotrichum gorgonifer]|uniref:Related to G-patch domain protein n=1 Tax=Cephalotrichum gorgonifer TaxID=2041049 RepID=A0AAE8MRV4_9PEZI|nr:related to G-patch domain protein [Cephalotrichum gorgonifer]
MPHRPMSSSRPSFGREMTACDQYDDFYDDVPLQHKKPFGAGLKRKRSVTFVRASDPDLHTIPATEQTPDSSVSDLYLNLVMKGTGGEPEDTALSKPTTKQADATPAEQTTASTRTCPVCNITLDDDAPESQRTHEASIAHQVALSHSHPPSAIDRSRMGLSYLASFGWDPDSRRGLGAEGQGVRDPIKAKQKDDTLGIGAVIPQEFIEKAREPKPKKLTGKELKQRELEEKRKGERLRELFYQRDDVLRHLGREI